MKTKFISIFKFLILLFVISGCCSQKLAKKVIWDNPNALRPQETNNWCWAATTQMVAQDKGISVKQCDLANHRFGKTNCCDYETTGEPCPKTDDCDEPGWLELDYAGLNFSQSTAALSWESIKNQLFCKKEVMGYAYGTKDVVGHVVVIKGFVTIGNTNYVVLNDPWLPCEGEERIITYEAYADPPGTATHWNTWYNISKK